MHHLKCPNCGAHIPQPTDFNGRGVCAFCRQEYNIAGADQLREHRGKLLNPEGVARALFGATTGTSNKHPELFERYWNAEGKYLMWLGPIGMFIVIAIFSQSLYLPIVVTGVGYIIDKRNQIVSDLFDDDCDASSDSSNEQSEPPSKTSRKTLPTQDTSQAPDNAQPSPDSQNLAHKLVGLRAVWDKQEHEKDYKQFSRQTRLRMIGLQLVFLCCLAAGAWSYWDAQPPASPQPVQPFTSETS